jgi:hypothetical protein
MRVSEEWRDCVGYPNYAVSSLGNIKNKKTGRILKPSIVEGYSKYKLSRDKVAYNASGHRVVALAFIPNPENKPTIDHIDRNQSNNAVTNLRWATYCENNQNKIGFRGAVPFRGVANHLNGKFQAHISINNTLIHIGLFDTAEEAHEMYDSVARAFYGEFYNPEN